MTISRRIQVAAGLIAAASCGILAALPASASASVSAAVVAPPHMPSAISGPDGPRLMRPADAVDQEACGGDVCMILDWDGFSPTYTVEVGANSNAFNGYFHLSGPGGPFHPANTPSEHWNAHGISGGDSYTYPLVAPPMAGFFCVSAFQDGSSIGKACVPYGIA